MAYERLHWVESETPLSADNMNNIEDGIEELQSQKVDKVSGKALSDQNYTSDEKTKLAGIEAGAQVNPGEATTSAAGLMSAADKTKLDGVQAGAQVNPGAATTSTAGLMSATDKSKLNGITTAAKNILTEYHSSTTSKTIGANGTGSLGFVLDAPTVSSVVGVSEFYMQSQGGTCKCCVSGWQLALNSSTNKVNLTFNIVNPTSSAITIGLYAVRVSYKV